MKSNEKVMKVVVVNPIQSQVYFHLTFQSVEMEKEANGGEGGAGDGEIPEIELIIRASTIDGRRKGACLFCQVGFLFLPFAVLPSCPDKSGYTRVT